MVVKWKCVENSGGKEFCFVEDHTQLLKERT